MTIAGRNLPRDAAIAAWRDAIGDAQVVLDTARYNRDTSGFTGDIPAALRPGTVAHVQEIVRIARRHRVPLYPVSTGHNWGYGTSVPVRSPAVLVDLAGMNRIAAFDRETGVVTLEPGVTQGDLAAYLRAHGLPYMVPVTGAGPACSIIGNALERGFGVTPLTDHFGAIVSLRAVLPDGTLFESRPHSPGPHLHGLFAQSNYGIVVEAKVALAPRPARCGALMFALDTDESADSLTATLRKPLRDAGSTIGAINLMNRERVATMLRGRADALPAGAWFGFGSVYGSAAHVRATSALVRRALARKARGVRIVTRADLHRLQVLAKAAAWFGRPALTAMTARLSAALDIVEGKPSTFALPLAYAQSGKIPPDGNLDPARDGCGLIWYAPTVPMRSGAVAQFCAFTAATCRTYGLRAPVTLTALSPRHYAATLPLLFDRADPDAERRAGDCYKALYDTGLTLGFEPYRIGAPFMPLFARQDGGGSGLAATIKAAIDPDGIIAPGRYQAG